MLPYTVDSLYNKLLGPSEINCYVSKKNYIRVAKTVKYKDILNFGTKKITLLHQDCVNSVFFITRVHCNTYIISLRKVANKKKTYIYRGGKP